MWHLLRAQKPPLPKPQVQAAFRSSHFPRCVTPVPRAVRPSPVHHPPSHTSTPSCKPFPPPASPFPSFRPPVWMQPLGLWYPLLPEALLPVPLPCSPASERSSKVASAESDRAAASVLCPREAGSSLVGEVAVPHGTESVLRRVFLGERLPFSTRRRGTCSLELGEGEKGGGLENLLSHSFTYSSV